MSEQSEVCECLVCFEYITHDKITIRNCMHVVCIKCNSDIGEKNCPLCEGLSIRQIRSSDDSQSLLKELEGLHPALIQKYENCFNYMIQIRKCDFVGNFAKYSAKYFRNILRNRDRTISRAFNSIPFDVIMKNENHMRYRETAKAIRALNISQSYIEIGMSTTEMYREVMYNIDNDDLIRILNILNSTYYGCNDCKPDNSKMQTSIKNKELIIKTLEIEIQMLEMHIRYLKQFGESYYPKIVSKSRDYIARLSTMSAHDPHIYGEQLIARLGNVPKINGYDNVTVVDEQNEIIYTHESNDYLKYIGRGPVPEIPPGAKLYVNYTHVYTGV